MVTAAAAPATAADREHERVLEWDARMAYLYPGIQEMSMRDLRRFEASAPDEARRARLATVRALVQAGDSRAAAHYRSMTCTEMSEQRSVHSRY